MKKLLPVLTALAICFSAWAMPSTAEDRPVVFTHAVIIDGSGNAPLEDGTLIVRGSKIEAVGRGSEIPVPAGANIIDARGRVLMPGLADMHVHLLGGWDGEAVDMLGYRRYLNALLYSGITTVLDMGSVKPWIIQLRGEIAAGRLTGPRVYCAGPLIDGPDPAWPPISISVCSAAQIPGIVGELKRDGVDIVKAYLGLSNPMMFALAAEARKNSLPVFVDQSWRNGSPEIAAAGIAAFAHTPDFIWGTEMITMLKDRGVRFISTLSVVEAKAKRRLEDLSFLDGPLIKGSMPPDFAADLRAYAKEAAESPSWNNGPKQQNLQRFNNQRANLKKLYDSGLEFAAGTDSPYPGSFLGEGLHRELELLVEAGLTPLQALTLATRNAARLMGAEAEWGSLAPGQRADILVVNGRPDRRIADTRNIDMVMRLGRIIDRTKLAFNAASDPGFRPVSPVSAAK
ncbi:MAG: amidohydrolase family protein [Candidatus Aminicenantes bacterium RBG_16_66_30]